MKAGDGTRIIPLVGLGLRVWLAARELAPPSIERTANDSAVFSVGRAMEDVRSLAVRPHPLGSVEHDRVRQWLLGRIRELGLEPEVQAVTVGRGATRFASVRNLVARVPGRRPEGRAVLLSAHYDSAPASPGAADDAAGVAALLEVLRVLGHDAAFQNDIILLITDGEESGLLGARAFVESHPFAKDVGVVLNLEARGHRGPSILFETSDGNENLVSVLSELDDPVTSSLTYEVYRRLPNDTDLTIFKQAGLPGLNFAFIGGLSHYHTSRDTAEHLDPRSLGHQGQSVLTLTRVLADLDLNGLVAARDRTYFSVLRRWVVQYPMALVWPLTGAVLLLFSLVLRTGFRRRRLDLRSLRTGVLVSLASTLLSVVVAWLMILLLTWRAQADGLARAIQIDGSAPIMCGLLCLSLSVGLLAVARFRVRSSREGLWAGALLVWAGLDLALTALLPGGSFLLIWPLLFASLGLLALLRRRTQQRPGPGLLAVCSAAVLPGLLLFVPLVWLLFEALTIRMAPAVVGMVGLLLGLLTPQMIQLVPGGRRSVPVLSALAGFALIGSSILSTNVDVPQPHFSAVFYALDLDRGAAVLGTFAPAVDDETSRFLDGARAGPIESFLPGFKAELLQRDAPELDLPSLELDLLESEQRGDHRLLTLYCRAPNGARGLTLRVDESTPVRLLSVNERTVFDAEGTDPWFPSNRVRSPFSLRYFALPTGGIQVRLAVQGDQPIEIQTLLQSDGLPALESFPGRPREDGLILRPAADESFVKRSFTF